MKFIDLKSVAYAWIIFSLAFLLGSCSEDAELSTEEKVRKLLTSDTWEPASTGSPITLEGIDVQDELFQGFTIKFTKDRIITAGTSPVWLREDTWRFKDKNATAILRGSDNREVTIIEVSEEQLIISLEWDQTTYESGRTKSLPGVYQFTLSK